MKIKLPKLPGELEIYREDEVTAEIIDCELDLKYLAVGGRAGFDRAMPWHGFDGVGVGWGDLFNLFPPNK